MKTLESFTKKVKPKRRQSKLKPYENEIKELYQKGYRVEQIQEFLQENKVSADRSYIFKFLKLNKSLKPKKFSFKNPTKSASKKQKKSSSLPNIEDDKALNAFMENIQKTAKNMKEYKEKEQ